MTMVATSGYTIRRGDTLGAIAARNGTTVAALARANGITNPDRIYAGRRLELPGRAGGDTYWVRAGDTLSGIAAANGTTVRDLQRLNAIRDPDLIFTGQVLRLSARPAPAGTASRAQAASGSSAAPAPSSGRAGVAGVSAAGLDAIFKREALAGVSDRLHWPGGASGVTLGAGYDMKGRSADTVVRDLTAAGVDRPSAVRASRGAGLEGAAARNFARSNRSAIDLTPAQETALLHATVPSYARAVTDAVKVPLNQNQYDALVSFAYNVGEGAFRGSSVLRRVNAGDLAGVPHELRRWNKSGGQVNQGLVNRREGEIAQFTRPTTARAGAAAPAASASGRGGTTPADLAARIEASGDHQARADLAAGRKVVVALRTPTNTGANGGGGTYDDTIAVVWRSGSETRAEVFTANTDPSGRYDGRYGRDLNGDGRLELGQLETGSYRYTRQSGSFAGHQFWRPDGSTAVRRDVNHDGAIDGRDRVDATGAGRSILIHAGGSRTTGSAGCQTMTVADLQRFDRALGGQRGFSYVLTDR